MTTLAIPDYKAMRRASPDFIPCPVCHDAEPASIYPGVRGFCQHCIGRGMVRKDSPDALCVHKFVFVANVGKCLNQYKCSTCGLLNTVDSSD